MTNNDNMDKWFAQVLSNKSIVDQLLETSEETVDGILNNFDEQKVEEIKICADLLSHKEEKYSAVAETVDNYQVRVGQKPNFSRK